MVPANNIPDDAGAKARAARLGRDRLVGKELLSDFPGHALSGVAYLHQKLAVSAREHARPEDDGTARGSFGNALLTRL